MPLQSCRKLFFRLSATFHPATGSQALFRSCRGCLMEQVPIKMEPVTLRMVPVPAPWRRSDFVKGSGATVERTMVICGAGPPDFFGPAPSQPLEWLSVISTGSKIPNTIPEGSSDTQTGSKIPKPIPEGSSDIKTGSIIPETIPEGHSGSVTGLKIWVLIQAGVLDGGRRSRWSDRRQTPTLIRRPSKAYHRRLLDTAARRQSGCKTPPKRTRKRPKLPSRVQKRLPAHPGRLNFLMAYRGQSATDRKRDLHPSDRGRPRPREGEGPAPRGVGGMS